MPPNETPALFRELHRSPWKRAKQDKEIYEQSVKRAKVIEVVVKGEADIMDSEMRYFPVKISCGACPSSNTSRCSVGKLKTGLDVPKLDIAKSRQTMRAVRRVADSRKIPVKKIHLKDNKRSDLSCKSDLTGARNPTSPTLSNKY